MAKIDTTSGQLDIFGQPLGQADLWSDVPAHTQAHAPFHPTPPPALPMYRHLMAKLGTTLCRLTCGQMYPPAA